MNETFFFWAQRDFSWREIKRPNTTIIILISIPGTCFFCYLSSIVSFFGNEKTFDGHMYVELSYFVGSRHVWKFLYSYMLLSPKIEPSNSVGTPNVALHDAKFKSTRYGAVLGPVKSAIRECSLHFGSYKSFAVSSGNCQLSVHFLHLKKANVCINQSEIPYQPK